MRKSIKYFIFSFLLLGLVSSPFLFESSHRDVTASDGGVFISNDSSDGPIFYPASYSSDVTDEPLYNTQKELTLDYMGYRCTPDYYRGDSVKVAVIDSGLYYDHEDFKLNGNRIIQSVSRSIENNGGWKYYEFSNNPSHLMDTLGHGSTVASVIASQINSLGSLGIAPNIDLYVYKVTNEEDGYEWTAIQNALQYCIDNDIDVVNMSFQAYEHTVSYGGKTMQASVGCSTVLQDMIDKCHNAGITLVGAAGNFNTTERSYPASNNHVISVGSLAKESKTTKAGFSNLSDIDLVAPGYVHNVSISNTSSYDETYGTSFSSPIVAAAIALYKQNHPNATPSQIESALYASCDKVGNNPSWAGNGRLNIDRFLGVNYYPTSIIINNEEVVDDELEIENGTTFQLDCEVEGLGSFNHNILYSINEDFSDEGVISIDSNGEITALSEGEAYVDIVSEADPNINAMIMVQVVAPKVVLQSISVTNPKTTFSKGDTFVCGGTVTATYTNAPSKDVTSQTDFSGYDMSTTGQQTVTASYTENGVTKTTSYTIKVNEVSQSEVNLPNGTFSTDHITWQTADGHTTVVQTKGNGSNAVSSNYISAPRVYKGHILSFTATTGYKIASIELKCDSTYYGNSMTAGTTATSTSVTDDPTNISRTWTTTSGGTHVVSAKSTEGLSTIYIQNLLQVVLMCNLD